MWLFPGLCRGFHIKLHQVQTAFKRNSGRFCQLQILKPSWTYILEWHRIIIFDDQFLPNNRAMKPSTNLSGPNPSACLECFDFVSPTKIEVFKNFEFSPTNTRVFLSGWMWWFLQRDDEMMIFWCYQKKGAPNFQDEIVLYKWFDRSKLLLVFLNI